MPPEETVETIEEVEEVTEETTEETVETTDELDETSLKDAKALFKLLKDPATQQATIRAMAAGAGLLGKDLPTTNVEVKEAKKDLKEILKKSLGPQLEWLAEKLAPAMQEMLDEERASATTKLASLEQSQIESATNVAWDKLHDETKGLSRKYEARMVQLADEVLPAANQSPLQYLRNLYKIASSDKTATTTRQQMAEKINRNSKDAPGRLVSGSSSEGVRATQTSGNRNLKDAVQNAINNVTKGHR